MRYRDPFSGKFTTRAKYVRAVQRIAREREKAFQRDDEKALRRLTDKARRYPALDSGRKPRRRAPMDVEETAVEWEFGLTYGEET